MTLEISLCVHAEAKTHYPAGRVCATVLALYGRVGGVHREAYAQKQESSELSHSLTATVTPIQLSPLRWLRAHIRSRRLV